MTNLKQLLRKSYIAAGIAFLLIITATIIGLTADQALFDYLSLPLIAANFLVTFFGLYFLYQYFHKAQIQHNDKALGKIILPAVLLISNIPINLLIYSGINYSDQSVAIEIQNLSQHNVKRLFFSNGDDKFFVKPLEPKEDTRRALTFNTTLNVNYTFTINGKIITGKLLNASAPLPNSINIKIGRNGRVNISKEASRKATSNSEQQKTAQ